MTPLKTQIEIKYTHVLNFKETYRAIVSPFIRLGNIEINNADTIQEFFVLKIPEDNILMDVRWDRMIFICDGKPSNLYSANGPLMYFFQILEQLQKERTFGEITGIGLGVTYLEPYELKEEEIVSRFKAKYYKEIPSLNDFAEVDLGVQVVFNEKTQTVRVQFGPFKKDDVQNFQLAPLWSKDISELLTKKGILGQIFISDKGKAVSLDSLRKLDRKIGEIEHQIKL